MKLNKTTYFSIFFLLCFLASFSTSTYQNFKSSNHKLTSKVNYKLTSFSSKEQSNDNNDNFLLEEIEDEVEEDFQAEAVLLPFLISYFQLQVLQPKIFPAQPFAEKATNPIYIAVRNFRI